MLVYDWLADDVDMTAASAACRASTFSVQLSEMGLEQSASEIPLTVTASTNMHDYDS